MARTHNGVVVEDSVFECAACVWAEVLEAENLAAFSYEEDWFAFEADGFHVVVFDFVFFYGWYKVAVVHFSCLVIILIGRES